MITPVFLRCEYAEAPLALATREPRFSWELAGAGAQTACRVSVASSPALLLADAPDIWDSGRRETDATFGLAASGAPLEPRTRYWWHVQVWDEADTVRLSEPGTFETGMFDSGWQARWIGAPAEMLPGLPGSSAALSGCGWIWADDTGAAATFRSSFELTAGELAALLAPGGCLSLWLAVCGPWELQLNGQACDTGTYWRTACLANLLPLARAGTNTLELRAPRTATGPAGVAAVLLRQARAKPAEARDLAPLWQARNHEGEPWRPAARLGTYGDEPWGLFRDIPPPADPIVLRREFELSEGEITAARLYLTALGVCRAELNGRSVGDCRLTPGWTDYARRVRYRAFDVTPLLSPGPNRLEAMLADGWYAGNVACVGRGVWGSAPRLLAELHVQQSDGSETVIATDGAWFAARSGIRAADLIKGEWRDDNRAAPPAWLPAHEHGPAASGPELTAATAPPLRVLRNVPARSTRPAGDGAWLADFGQNLSGHVRLNVPAPAAAASPVRIRHAERLDDAGGLYTENLRGAVQLDTFTPAAAGGVFEPEFTIHGFRYALVEGRPGELHPRDITAREVSSDLRRTGEFDCSDPVIAGTYHAILWTQRSNYGAVPTDCPNRDERMGWLDVHAFAPTAMFNYDLAAYYQDWLASMRDAQYDDGVIPHVVPDVLAGGGGEAGWADCCVLLPWLVYRRYGDSRVLEDNYAMMTRWLGFLQGESPDGVRPAEGFGDWLAIGEETPRDLIGTAYYAHSATTMARVAEALAGRPGMNGNAQRWKALAAHVTEAFRRGYVREEAGRLRIGADTQTGYVLALAFGLLPRETRQAAADRLAHLIDERGTLATGYMGLPKLLEVLSDWGHHDIACRLARSREFPGWGFMLKNGATTLWERWDSWRPGQPPGDPAMNSFNHPSLGAVGNWMVRCLTGLDSTEPGWRSALLAPRPGRGVTCATASYHGMAGRFRLAWEQLDEGATRIEATVPPGASARLVPPPGTTRLETSGGNLPATTLPLGPGEHVITAIGGHT